TDRQAATDYLPQRRQIGLDAESRLRTAVRDAEAGHDFVEDQQGAMLARDRANALEEAGRRWDEAAVADHRLDDDAGDALPLRLQQSAQCADGVVGSGAPERGRRARTTRRVGQAERRDATPRLVEEVVGVTVVAPLDLHDDV